MSVNIELVREISERLARMHMEGCKDPYMENKYIYSIEFRPESGAVSIHVQFGLMREIVAAETWSQLEVKESFSGSAPWLHVSIHVGEIQVVSTLLRSEIVELLKKSDFPDGFGFEDYGLETLFRVWQKHTGWAVESIEGGGTGA